MPMSNSATEQSNPWTYDVNSGLSTGGDLYEYNGMIYLPGEYNRVYIPATSSWRILTGQGYIRSSGADCTAFYNGKLYEHASWWGTGDTYSSGYKITEYNISNNTSRVLISRSSGGHFYEAAVACNGRIYFSGGTFVVYDEDVPQDYEQVDYYDIDENVKGTVIAYGGSDYPVLCTEPGEYYNHIFYFGNSGDILCVDTSDNSYGFLTGGSGYTNLYEEMVCTANNKVYFMGGATDSELEYSDVVSTVRIYDIESGTWSTGANMPYATAGATPHLYGGRIYLVGGYYAGTNVQIYDIATNTWSSGVSSSLSVGTGKSALLDGKIYTMTNDGTLCIYDINGSGQGIVRDRLVSVGDDHVVWLNNRTVCGYGNNSSGQIGSTTGKFDHFIEVNRAWTGVIVKVETHSNTTFLLTKDNVLYAMGSNTRKQIGNGITDAYIYSAVQVMTGVVDVAAGKYHTVVLKENGDVYGWGDNSYKQINPNGGSTISTAYKIASGATIIAAGDYQTFYNDSSGQLHGLGKNDKGQVGYPENVPNPIQVECGAEHTVAIGSDRHMYVWGSDEYRQLPVYLPNSATYTDVPKDTGIIVENISAGGNFTAYIDTELRLCGYGKSESSRVTTIPNMADAKAIAVGKKYCVAVKEEQEYDEGGEVVEGSTTDEIWRFGPMTDTANLNMYRSTAPCKIDYEHNILEVDSYRNQTLAINDIGQVVAWGQGYYADGSDSMKTHEYPTVISGITDPAAVSRGKNHNLVLDKNGDVWGWGSNTNNPMGTLGGKVKTVTKLSGISNVKQIAAGTEFSLFLKNDGTLWGVGKNTGGQLGQGNTVNYSSPVQITDRDDFIKVSVGESYAAALTSDGIYTWGSGILGVLGRGNSVRTSLIPEKVNITLESGDSFVDVIAGMKFCLALTSKGYIYIWGDNDSGVYGRGNTSQTYMPARVGGLSNIVSIDAAPHSIVAVNKSGAVYSWGYGYDGQLGYEATSKYYPSRVSALNGKNIKSVTCGYDFTVAISESGELYTFGSRLSEPLGFYTSTPLRFGWDSAVLIERDGIYEDSMSSVYFENYYRFAPKESGTYIFSTTECDSDIDLKLYDENKNLLAPSTKIDEEFFPFSYYFEAGKLYYLRIHRYNSESITYKLHVEVPMSIVSISN